jgi:hypothetical protein
MQRKGESEMDISTELHTSLTSAGASLVGFADLTGATPTDKSSISFGISIAVAIENHIVSDIVEGPTSAYIEECLRLDDILTALGQYGSGVSH